MADLSRYPARCVKDAPDPDFLMLPLRVSRVVKNGSVVSILRVSAKRRGDDKKTGGVSTEIR
jgi:hypothetical protein